MFFTYFHKNYLKKFAIFKKENIVSLKLQSQVT